MRPVLPSGCQSKSSYCSAVGSIDAVTLSGYGVELALKNMEYKAMDDTAIKKGRFSNFLVNIYFKGLFNITFFSSLKVVQLCPELINFQSHPFSFDVGQHQILAITP